MSQDEELPVTPGIAFDFSCAVFTQLFLLLHRKGVLNLQEIGKALTNEARDLKKNPDDSMPAFLETFGDSLTQAAATLAKAPQ